MHRALEREGLAEDRHPARYVLHRENATERIVGRVLDKGLGGDEMGELAGDDPTLLAIVLSHGHRDHWGFVPKSTIEFPW
jgi:glyoxylase-like metal-dependent hydrolase (beta-lactamase superfamily II)